MDSLKYEICQREQFEKFESICKRCGKCCGSQDGDWCVHLTQNPATGEYYCKVYENRIGFKKTVNGKGFYCIPIRDIVEHGCIRPDCAYNK